MGLILINKNKSDSFGYNVSLEYCTSSLVFRRSCDFRTSILGGIFVRSLSYTHSTVLVPSEE